MGPLPTSRGFSYCLTCVARFSRWPEAFPITNISAENVAKTFLYEWITRFGIPLKITTDQGRQFESQLFTELNNIIGSKHLSTTAYHPQANGFVERFHRQLKAAIRCHATERWTDVLSIILLGIRSAWREEFEARPADLIYGQTLRLPGEFLATHKITNFKEPSPDFTTQL